MLIAAAIALGILLNCLVERPDFRSRLKLKIMERYAQIRAWKANRSN